MSKKRDVFPRTIGGFNTYFVLVLAYIITNATRLRISDEDLAALKLMMTNPDMGWKDLFALHEDPATQTKLVNTNIEISLNTTTKFLQSIYCNISRKDMIIQDYITFNISLPNPIHHRKGAIINTPFGKITAIGGGVLKFDVRTSAEATTARMYPLADVIRVVGIILKPGDPLPMDISDCTVVFTSTKANFKHTFSVAEAGNRFVYYLQYVNQSDESKNEPLSEIHICIIVG